MIQARLIGLSTTFLTSAKPSQDPRNPGSSVALRITRWFAPDSKLGQLPLIHYIIILPFIRQMSVQVGLGLCLSFCWAWHYDQA